MESTSVHRLDPAVYTVPDFCKEHRISRSYLYRLWSEGRGPRRTKVGRRTLISGEAAAEWRRRMEAETVQRDGEAF
jgi:predicted DNA-binding transcriptional regulator AlpA